jgi:uncharacterized protein
MLPPSDRAGSGHDAAEDDHNSWGPLYPGSLRAGYAIWPRRALPARRGCGYSGAVIVAGVSIDEARLAVVCERYGVGRLMGLRLACPWDRRPGDVDVLYDLRPGRRLGWEIEDLADELSELFGRQVDLVSRAALHERLRAAVLAEARPLYAA